MVQLACARCGHQQMYVVDSTEKDETVEQGASALNDREMDADDASTSAAMRQRRLESLPTSLPVGGIITPV
jgi:hypothetical protein